MPSSEKAANLRSSLQSSSLRRRGKNGPISSLLSVLLLAALVQLPRVTPLALAQEPGTSTPAEAPLNPPPAPPAEAETAATAPVDAANEPTTAPVSVPVGDEAKPDAAQTESTQEVAPQAEASDAGKDPASEPDEADELAVEFGAALGDARKGALSLDELAQKAVSLTSTFNAVPAGIESVRDELPGFEQLLGTVLVTRISQRLADEDPKTVEPLRALAKAALSPESEQVPLIDRLFSLAERADKAIKSNDRAALIAVGEGLQNPAEKTVVAKRLVALSGASEAEILESDDPFGAVKKLAELSSVFRTVQTTATLEKLIHTLAEKAENGTLDFEKWTFDDTGVRLVLSDAVTRTPSLKEPLVQLYEHQLIHCLDTRRSENLRSYYGTILTFRPDPDEANNKLRLQVAVHAKSDDGRHFALGRLEELKEQGALTLRNKLWLLARGYYGWTQPILFILVWLFILSVTIIVVVRPAFFFGWLDRRRKDEEERLRKEHETEEFYRQRRLASQQYQPTQRKLWVQPEVERHYDMPGYARGLSSEDDYSRLLSYFGLNDEATEDDIKRAYRDMVKQHHPDNLRRSGDVDPEEIERAEANFMKIKETYDRLMEMRGSWFGGKR